MSDKTPVPANGDGIRKGALDGVSGAPGHNPGEGVNGRTEASESGGGGYPNPHTGQSGGDGLDHGGQSEMKYYGSGQAGGDGRSGPNSVAGSNDADAGQGSTLPPPSAEREPHVVNAGGRSFAVVEASGVAAAEASGRVGSQADDEPEDESKLAG